MKNETPTAGISALMRNHYGMTFTKYGCSMEGVDWGNKEIPVAIRHKNMEAVIQERPASVLDVGCGYGAFMDHVTDPLTISYTGIDLVEAMIESGQERHPDATFICGDILELSIEDGAFDYVICNGIMTQKLAASQSEMDVYSKRLIRKMYALAKKGIAFNVMSTFVNFQADNLYYKSPLEMLGWAMQEISPHVRLDHSYPLYEYTMYLFTSKEFAH